MTRQIAFEEPLWLLLLLGILPLLYYLYRTSYSPLSRLRELTTFWLRVSVFVLLVLALAGTRQIREVDELCVMFVVDWSDSMTEQGRKQALTFLNRSLKQMTDKDRAGVIVFANQAYIEEAPRKHLGSLRRIQTELKHKTATNIAGALQLALSSLPRDAQKRIVLISDGNENLGDAAEQARLARNHGAEIITVPIDNRLEKEVLIEAFDLPAFVRKGEAFTIQVRLRAYQAGKGSLDIHRNDKFLKKIPVAYRAGVRTIRIEQRLDEESPLVKYEVSLVDVVGEDTIAENNSASGSTRVVGLSRVLLIDGHRRGDGEDRLKYLVGALREGGIDVVVRGVGGVPATPAKLNAFDALILSDVPVMPLRYQQELIRDYVKIYGGGLVMIGGKDSFGMGGYWKTPIEQALPVHMDIRKKRFASSVAISIVIDSSGSMGRQVKGKTKLQLACEGAIATLDLLGPSDQLEVILCDTEVKTLMEMQPVGGEQNKAELRKKLRNAELGGGGIYTMTALKPAFRHLASLGHKAMIKHVILFADGSDTEEKQGVPKLVRQYYRDHKITLSTISLGRGDDEKHLKKFAGAGHGHYYLVVDASHLPRIFTKDTMLISKSAVIEGKIPPRLVARVPMIDGIDWDSAPDLLGYVVTTARKRAELLLIARNKDRRGGADQIDPILARWRYGLGKSLAFTSDAKNRWARNWVGWAGFKKFWAQSVRWTMRKEQLSEFSKRLVIRGFQGRIEVDAEDLEGKIYTGLDLEALVQEPDGGAQIRVPLKQVGAGKYVGEFKAFEDGTYSATIKMRRENEADALLGSLFGVRSYADEYRKLEPERFRLRQLARLSGGRMTSSPEGIFEHKQEQVLAAQEIWRILLALGLLLFFLDILARRLVFPEEMRRFADKLLTTGRQVPAAASPSPVRPTLGGEPEALRPVGPLRMTRGSKGDPRPTVKPAGQLSTEVPGIDDDEETYTSRLLAAKQRARSKQQEKADEADEA